MERTILTAIAMHPTQRPLNVAELREMLQTSSLPSSLPPSLLPLVPAEGEWRQAMIENRGLLLLAAATFTLAVLATFF